MNREERTRDIYEHIPGYIQPPVIPLKAQTDLYTKNPLDLNLSPGLRIMARTILQISGFNSFLKKLPSMIEDLLRTTNLRGPALFAPAVSATLAMIDDPNKQTPVERAVSLILGCYSLYDDIHQGRLTADRYKEEYLEMGQYPNLFATSIILEKKGPRLYKSTCNNQISVVCNEQFFLIEIEDWHEKNLASRLTNTLNNIIKISKEENTKQVSPGYLSAANDLTQYRAFKIIRSKKKNAANLDDFKHSLFTLCLDLDDAPKDAAECAHTSHSKNFGNRWHHSSLQLVVFKNAKAAAICSFSTYIDGNTMVRAVSEICQRSAKQEVASKEAETGVVYPIKKVEWEIPAAFLAKAKQDLKGITDTQQATFTIEKFGKEFFKSIGFDAVPSFVCALEIAAQKLTGNQVKITQFLTMSKYRYMDLTTVPVATEDVMSFANATLNSSRKNDELKNLLQKANQSQTDAARKARQQLPFSDIMALYRKTKKGPFKLFSNLLMSFMFFLIQSSGAMRHLRREIVISHPSIVPEIPVLGRPGAKLPYTTHFGLHYQIFNDSIVITMMPGKNWKHSNEEVINAIKFGLEKISGLKEL